MKKLLLLLLFINSTVILGMHDDPINLYGTFIPENHEQNVEITLPQPVNSILPEENITKKEDVFPSPPRPTKSAFYSVNKVLPFTPEATPADSPHREARSFIPEAAPADSPHREARSLYLKQLLPISLIARLDLLYLKQLLPISLIARIDLLYLKHHI